MRPQVGLDVLQQVAGGGQRRWATTQRGAIGDEHGLRAQDDAALQRSEVVVAQGNSRRDQVADEIGVANSRGDLQCALDGDQLIGADAAAVQERGRQARELGGHTQRPPGCGQLGRPTGQIGHRLRRRVFRRGQRQAARPEAQRLMDDQDGTIAIRAPLGQHVVAGDAKLDTALLHAGDNVARPLKHHRHAGQRRDGGRVLARVGPGNLEPARRQEIERPVL